MTRPYVSLTTIGTLLLLASPARANESMFGGFLGAGSGLEMGDGGNGKTVLRRARTRLEGGADMRIDDFGKHRFGVAAFAELEPHTSFGGEVRYGYALTPKLSVFGGVAGLFAPHWLIGAVGGASIKLPMGTSGLGLYIQPSISAMPFGSELPTERPLIWLHLTVGARFDFLPDKKNDG